MPRSPAAQARWGNYFEDPTRFTEIGTQQRAIERGQRIEVAKPDTLQLDIDGPEAYERFEEQLAIWNNCPTLPALGRIVERNSRTPGNKHITIELPTEYDVEYRIMLQALLGSDLKRELLSLASIGNGHANPIVFYRPMEEGNAEAEAEPRNGTDRSTDVPVAGGRSGSDATPRRRPRRRRDRVHAPDANGGGPVASTGGDRVPPRRPGLHPTDLGRGVTFNSALFDELAGIGTDDSLFDL